MQNIFEINATRAKVHACFNRGIETPFFRGFHQSTPVFLKDYFINIYVCAYNMVNLKRIVAQNTNKRIPPPPPIKALVTPLLLITGLIL